MVLGTNTELAKLAHLKEGVLSHQPLDLYLKRISMERWFGVQIES
jgi:hypothetical protein